MALTKVFEPIQIGPIRVANRVVRTAHASMMGVGGRLNEEMIGYHEARAKGGCGLSIIEAASIHYSTKLSDLAIWSDTIVEDYQKLMARIRPHGMKMFQQLWHGGNLYNGFDGEPGWAVSSVTGMTGLVCRTMTEAMIYELVDSFKICAVNVRDGGLDGVEIHAAHGYLPQQFLSFFYNNRTDKWGGSFENRNRFLMEVLRAVRAAVGGQIAIGIRLSAADTPGGVDEEENQRVIRAVEAEGLIDYVNVSRGDYFLWDTMVGGMSNPTGYELNSSATTASVATVPRILTGRFRTLEEVDQVIREGLTDMVSMVRAQIADPDLVRKTREGRALEVRPCIGCNQHFRGGHFGCAVNVAAGAEYRLSEELIVKTETPKKVLIIGGGPAGMEAARIAALKGHKVVLCEASPDLGGRINIAKKAPKAASIGDIAVWLEQEIYRLGVDVRLNTYMEVEDVLAEGADQIIVATGSLPRMDGVQWTNPALPARGADQSHVVSSNDLFTASRDWGKTAVVLDTVGEYEAIAVAEELLSHGVKVTYITPEHAIGEKIVNRIDVALQRFYRLGEFRVLCRHHLAEITKDECIVRPLYGSDNMNFSVPADTVVLVTQNEPLTDIWDALHQELHYRLTLVGDARQPRDLTSAIREGHLAARSIA